MFYISVEYNVTPPDAEEDPGLPGARRLYLGLHGCLCPQEVI